MSSVPDEQAGEVGGLQNTVTNLGASISTARAGAVLISTLTSSFLAGIEQDPDVPAEVTAQADVRLAGGIPFVSSSPASSPSTRPDRPTAVDDLDALDCAVEGFGERLALVADRWTAPTPCDEWDVRWLCAHVVGGNRFASLILGGASADDAMSQVMTMRHIGERPVDDLRAGAAEMRDAFAAPGARQRTVSHLVGELTGEQFLRLRIYDVVLHTWDLARALGAPDHLDDDLVRRVLADVDGGPIGATPGTHAKAATPGLSNQDRLLLLTGRNPTWTPPPPPPS